MPLHWNCCVAGCTSNWRNWKSYHRVPLMKSILAYYKAFLKTDGVDWASRPLICSRHWSTPRTGYSHLPDIRLPHNAPESHSISERELRHLALNERRQLTTPTTSSDSSIVNVEDAVSHGTTVSPNNMKSLAEKSKARMEHVKSKEIQRAKLEDENEELKKQVKALQVENRSVIAHQNALQTALAQMKSLSGPKFDWQSLTATDMEMFTGFTKSELQVLYDCFHPYIHLLQYEDCVDSMNDRRKLSKPNEFLATMAVCRHALPLNIVAWMLQVSQPTLTRIFEAWITFGDAVFSSINIQPSRNLITSKMPDVFKKLGYGHVTLVLDATELKVGQFTDLNLNTLFYSDYKQGHTVKALVCLSPHGALTKIPDLFPGSITDTKITELTEALGTCNVLDGVLTDKGFAISELAAELGAEHNRPPMKSQDLFTEGECDDNFKIACLRIHVERWIGYLRNFKILNTVWPCQRLDLLNSVWRFLASVQGAAMLVKPKEGLRR